MPKTSLDYVNWTTTSTYTDNVSVAQLDEEKKKTFFFMSIICEKLLFCFFLYFIIENQEFIVRRKSN
jgi:hypothetical protein